MLTDKDIERVKDTFTRFKKAETDAVSLEAELNMLKKQAVVLFKKYNIKGFSEIPKLNEKLEELDNSILEEEKKALAYIEQINKVREEKENILVG